MANTLIAQLNNPAVLLQINRRLATAVSLLLVVACAYLLVEATWLFFPQEEETTMMPVKQNNRVVNNKQTRQENFRKLTSANIFGVSDKGATAQKQATVPETRLNLTLKGVLSETGAADGESMKRASAIIAQGKSGKEDIYGVGDKLPGGVLIKEIHPEYVVLDRNGQLETLKLEKISGIADIESSAQPSSQPALRSNKSPGAALNVIRDSILKDPASFGDYALPVVVRENGRQVGYRLQPQKKGSLLSELGVQSTDIVTQVNGVKLDRPQNGIRALRTLSTAKSLNIVVKRNGAEIPLNISLQ